MNTYYLVNLYYEYNVAGITNLLNNSLLNNSLLNQTNQINIITGTILVPLTQIQANILDYMIRVNRIDKFIKLTILSYITINQETYNANYEMLNDKYYKVNNTTIQQYNVITSIGNILHQK
jgi:hypothetical protein